MVGVVVVVFSLVFDRWIDDLWMRKSLIFSCISTSTVQEVYIVPFLDAAHRSLHTMEDVGLFFVLIERRSVITITFQAPS